MHASMKYAFAFILLAALLRYHYLCCEIFLRVIDIGYEVLKFPKEHIIYIQNNNGNNCICCLR